MAYLFDRLTTDPDQRNAAYDLATSLGCEPTGLAQALLHARLRDLRHLLATTLLLAGVPADWHLEHTTGSPPE